MLHIASNIFHFLGLNLRENVLAFAHFLAHNSAESLAHLVQAAIEKKTVQTHFSMRLPFTIVRCTMYDLEIWRASGSRRVGAGAQRKFQNIACCLSE